MMQIGRGSFARQLVLLLLGVMTLAIVLFEVYKSMVRPHLLLWERIHSDVWKCRVDAFGRRKYKLSGVIFAGTSLSAGFDFANISDANIHVINMGVPGDFTQGLLRRLDVIVSSRPGKLFIETGINDILAGFEVEDIALSYALIVEHIRRGSPQTEIYVQSILPTGFKDGMFADNYKVNRQIKLMNRLLQKYCHQEDLVYVDLYSHFLYKGQMNPCLTTDGVHLNDTGYRLWWELVSPYITDIQQ